MTSLRPKNVAQNEKDRMTIVITTTCLQIYFIVKILQLFVTNITHRIFLNDLAGLEPAFLPWLITLFCVKNMYQYY